MLRRTHYLSSPWLIFEISVNSRTNLKVAPAMHGFQGQCQLYIFSFPLVLSINCVARVAFSFLVIFFKTVYNSGFSARKVGGGASFLRKYGNLSMRGNLVLMLPFVLSG